ncbi:hypothetical protein [Rubrivirga marina]|uniref:Uncharacterized protein n=1 Tax=Rubrivirga marina TaxID=1196024 RepID=A0A271J0F2_9BACT|nr:hypothetical protein [Rubrivirga marina]PAP76718.1 hypothetical protein BSZ37_09835 [Rubrivirga marina]
MRLLGLLVALAAVAAPASAQQRFVQACAASPDVQQVEGIDAGQLCGCVAERTIARGIPAADLDRSIEYSSADLASAPDEIRAVAEAAMEATVPCALAQAGVTEAMMDGVAAASPAPEAPAASAVTGTPVPMPAEPAPTVYSGLRTGDGTGSVRVEQEGKGGAIRILGE